MHQTIAELAEVAETISRPSADSSPDTQAGTPSDFALVGLDDDELSKLAAVIEKTDASEEAAE